MIRLFCNESITVLLLDMILNSVKVSIFRYIYGTIGIWNPWSIPISLFLVVFYVVLMFMVSFKACLSSMLFWTLKIYFCLHFYTIWFWDVYCEIYMSVLYFSYGCEINAHMNLYNGWFGKECISRLIEFKHTIIFSNPKYSM